LGRTGLSNTTGHYVKIWDRNFAFHGYINPEPCPKDNWVSMPIVEVKFRQQALIAKEHSFDEWDQNCPYQNIHSDKINLHIGNERWKPKLRGLGS
jgi:hypothetical protein